MMTVGWEGGVTVPVELTKPGVYLAALGSHLRAAQDLQAKHSLWPAGTYSSQDS